MSSISEAIRDIRLGLKRYAVWHTMATEDLRIRYRRTSFGVLWLTATFSLFILAKTLVFGGLMAVPLKEYTLYMATAFLVWGFISATVTDGCSVWINAEPWLRGMNIPKSIFVYQVVYRNLMTSMYSAIAVLIIFIAFRHQLTWNSILSIPALIILILNAIWVVFLFGVISTRYRDFIHLVRTAMGIMFFMTPILWIPRTMGPKFELFALYNPFSHMIAIFRDPLVYGTSDPINWIVCICITLLGWALSFGLFVKFRTRLVFWF